MIEPFFWIIWTFGMLMSGYAVWNAATFLRRGQKREAEWAELALVRRRVALIVAVKGYDANQSPTFFQSLENQDYEDYRVILTVESEADPAAVWAREHLDLDSGDFQLVVAGSCEGWGRGQKVHNQMAAFEQLTVSDDVIAFADADIRMPSDWLTRLVMPINAGTHQLATTYRWLVPDSRRLVNYVASVMNAAVATMGGNDQWNLTWGGSMAIARDDFDALDVPQLFSGSLNDDLRLGKYARQQGRKIAFSRTLLIASPVDYTVERFVEFVRRQYYQVRHFAPLMWKISFIALWTYPIVFFTSVAALVFWDYQVAWIPIILVTLFDQFRAFFRQRLVKQLFSGKTPAKLAPCRWVEHFATPIWMTLHAVLAASASLMNRVTWAGIAYRVISPEKTEILARKDPHG